MVIFFQEKEKKLLLLEEEMRAARQREDNVTMELHKVRGDMKRMSDAEWVRILKENEAKNVQRENEIKRTEEMRFLIQTHEGMQEEMKEIREREKTVTTELVKTQKELKMLAEAEAVRALNEDKAKKVALEIEKKKESIRSEQKQFQIPLNKMAETNAKTVPKESTSEKEKEIERLKTELQDTKQNQVSVTDELKKVQEMLKQMVIAGHTAVISKSKAKEVNNDETKIYQVEAQNHIQRVIQNTKQDSNVLTEAENIQAVAKTRIEPDIMMAPMDSLTGTGKEIEVETENLKQHLTNPKEEAYFINIQRDVQPEQVKMAEPGVNIGDKPAENDNIETVPGELQNPPEEIFDTSAQEEVQPSLVKVPEPGTKMDTSGSITNRDEEEKAKIMQEELQATKQMEEELRNQLRYAQALLSKLSLSQGTVK